MIVFLKPLSLNTGLMTRINVLIEDSICGGAHRNYVFSFWSTSFKLYSTTTVDHRGSHGSLPAPICFYEARRSSTYLIVHEAYRPYIPFSTSLIFQKMLIMIDSEHTASYAVDKTVALLPVFYWSQSILYRSHL